jgi:hypothetical protein
VKPSEIHGTYIEYTNPDATDYLPLIPIALKPQAEYTCSVQQRHIIPGTATEAILLGLATRHGTRMTKQCIRDTVRLELTHENADNTWGEATSCSCIFTQDPLKRKD